MYSSFLQREEKKDEAFFGATDYISSKASWFSGLNLDRPLCFFFFLYEVLFDINVLKAFAHIGGMRYKVAICLTVFFFPPLIMEYCSFQPRAPLLGGFSPFIFSSLCLLSTHTYIYTHTHTRSFSAVSSLEYFTAFTNSAALLFCEEEEQSCTHGYHRLPSLIPLFLSATSAVTLIIIQPKGDNSDRFFLLSLSLLLLLVVILCLLLLLLLLLL